MQRLDHWNELRALDTGFKEGAYEMVKTAFETIRDQAERNHETLGNCGASSAVLVRKVDTDQIVQGVSDLAKENFGMMAAFTLKQFGVYTSEDISHLVDNMLRTDEIHPQEMDMSHHSEPSKIDLAHDLSLFTIRDLDEE